MVGFFSGLRARAVLAQFIFLVSGCGGGGGGAEADLGVVCRNDTPPTQIPALSTAEKTSLIDRLWYLDTIQLNRQDSLDGSGILLAIIDGAIQVGHPDLVGNYVAAKSCNFLSDNPDPSPTQDSTDAHGTAVAGILLANGSGGFGMRGIAPSAKFLALSVLDHNNSARLGDATWLASASGADVVNNSWGPADPELISGESSAFHAAPKHWQSAIAEGISKGRNGKGTVYVISAGNGGAYDNSNLNGYANHHGLLAVGAVDRDKQPAFFSEPGANILIAAPSAHGSSASENAIWTTDLVGEQGYARGDYAAFNGTSAATPMVSGVVALMLQANPNLTWRDVRWLLGKTASPAQGVDGLPSAMGNHGYDPRVGFGVLNAQAAITEAKAFAGLGPQKTCSSGNRPVNKLLPDQASIQKVTEVWSATTCAIKVVEFVSVQLAVAHPYVGDLRIKLLSPEGKVSELSVPHLCPQNSCARLDSGWTFGSVRHMGESMSTESSWSLELSDEVEGLDGSWLSWEVTIWGH